MLMQGYGGSMPIYETPKRKKPLNRVDPNTQKRLTLADSYFDEMKWNLGLAQFYLRQNNNEEANKYMRMAVRCFEYAKRLRGKKKHKGGS